MSKKKNTSSKTEVLDAEGSEPSQKTQSSPLSMGSDRALVPSPGRAISPLDPLSQYMREVQQYDLLTAEEEVELVDLLQNSEDIEKAKRAAHRLVSSNLRLVVKIAFEYRNAYHQVMDLIQEGNVGLMKAVSKFDPSKGARLGYYASWWIRSYILKYILDNFRLVKIGTTQAQKKLFYQLMREKERLEAQGIQAAPKLLAERLDVREKDVVEMQTRLSQRGAELSIDTPLSPGDSGSSSATYSDFLEDESDSVDDTVSENQLIEMIRSNVPELKSELNEKELKVMEDRILSESPKTLQQVADLYGISRERVRQIEANVIEKLRKKLEPHLR